MTKENIKSWSIALLIIGVVVIIGYAILHAVINTWINHTVYDFRNCKAVENCKDITDGIIATWGQTGDFFGGILNPIFTFIGFIFVIVTLNQNQKSLEHSIDSARKEQFEATFFNLLSLSNEVKAKLDLKKINLSGETTEFSLYLEIEGKFRILNLKNIQEAKNMLPKIYQYTELIDIYHTLEQYYQNIYNIMTFIDNADFLKDNLEYKKVYANVIRSQLSIYETGLLFFAFLCYENGKFCRLAKEWGMFDILFNDSLFNEQFKREDFSLEKLYISLLN